MTPASSPPTLVVPIVVGGETLHVEIAIGVAPDDRDKLAGARSRTDGMFVIVEGPDCPFTLRYRVVETGQHGSVREGRACPPGGSVAIGIEGRTNPMSAEWCEHDDLVLHDVVDGKNLAIHVRVQQLSIRAQLKDWSAAGNIRLATSDAPGMVGVQITGPQHEWKVSIFANHGYAMVEDAERTYHAGETVTITLKAT